MSLSKYINETDERHGGNLFWPGALGLPYRGSSAPTLNQDDLDQSTEIQNEFKFKEFDLSNEEDAQHYCWVMDRVANGWFMVFARKHWRDKKTKSHKIYLEWSQRYSTLSPDGVARHGHSLYRQSSIQRVI